MRYLRDPRKADDFMHSMNYALMMKRLIYQEATIPNQQLVRELAGQFGVAPLHVNDPLAAALMSGDYVGG
jgi:hypothetical protein